MKFWSSEEDAKGYYNYDEMLVEYKIAEGFQQALDNCPCALRYSRVLI